MDADYAAEVTNAGTDVGADDVTVAFDAGPLLGPMTGVGAAVEQMRAALGARRDVTLRPYALSLRGELLDGMVRLPLPAAVALRLWSRFDGPRLDRSLRPADVLHGTNYVVGPSRLPRLASVYDCWFLRHPELAAPNVRLAGVVLRRAAASGAMIHVSSHATAEHARDLLSTDRVEVVPLAALPQPAAAGTSDALPTGLEHLAGRRFVLAIGTLERRKNVPTLVRAFGALAHSDVDLVLAGAPGDDEPAIAAALDTLPPERRARVVRTGRIDEPTKAWLLRHARALAYPSLDEGFGFPLLEAMQHDLPIVASTAGSIPEVAGDAAVLVEPRDVDALGGALVRVLDDDATRGELVARGRKRLTAFSWSTTAARLTELYRRLSEEGS